MWKQIFAGASLISMSACSTSLAVKPVEQGPQSGVVYALPMTQFKIDIVRQVASCDGGNMKVKNTFNVEKVSIEDPDNIFVIKPDSLSHFLNTASTEIKFHEGSRRIKSFNSAVVENTGPTIGAIIKGAVGLMTVPSPFGFAEDPITCWDEGGIKKKVEAAIEQEKVVKQTTKDINAQMLLVAKLTAEKTALLPGSTTAMDAKLAAAVAHLKSLKDRSTEEEKAFTELLKPITFKQSLVWPKSGKTLARQEPIRIPVAALEKWVGPDSAGEPQIEALDIYLSLAADSGTARQAGQPMRTDKNGLYYRTPAQGALVFTGTKLVDEARQAAVLHRHKDTIAQLGYVNSLSIDAGPFESIEFSAEFDNDGGLVSAGYKETASPSAAVSSLIDTAVEQYRTAGTYRAGREQAKLDAELKALQSELAIKEANEKLTPAETSEEAQALEALTDETTLLNAQIARLEAEKKLLELQGQ